MITRLYKSRWGFLIRTYAVTVLIFIIAKVVFMLAGSGSHPFTAGDVADVIAHGLSLDLSMSLYLIAVPFLCAVASIWTGCVRPLRILLRVYFALIALALALAFVADTSLYTFWQFKIDASCLQYLDTPTEAMASVSTGYILLRALILLATAYLIYLCYTLRSAPPLRSAKNSPLGSAASLREELSTLNSQPSTHRIAESLVALLCIPLIVIGIRGGLGESTTNIGQVYYSQNQFLNHSAVNPVFSFFASLEKTASMHVTYDFMDQAVCDSIMTTYYSTESIAVDTVLTSRQPNVVVILLESCGGMFTEIGGRSDITPNLNRLAHEGVYFTNCIANSWRTDRGTACTWSGYPSFPTMSVMKMPSKSRSLPCLARTLAEERGYTTSYIYGGDINFTNMRSFLVSGGFQTLTWEADYNAEERASAKWGVRDDITFETLYQQCATLPQPFLIGYSTLSSHEPWDVPLKHFDDEVHNAFYYLDQCIGRFIAKLATSKLWENTLIVLLPDHGIPYGADRNGPLMNHIPMIWTGGAVKGARQVTQVCNQTDLAATLLGQMGIAHDDYTFSRDVLSQTYTRPFAINTYEDGYAMYDSASFVNFDFISNRIIAREGRDNPDLLLRGRAILQAASKDLEKR